MASKNPRAKGRHARPLTLPPSRWRSGQPAPTAASNDPAAFRDVDTVEMLEKMSAQIENLRSAYHIDAKPLASDEEYDALIADLQDIIAQARRAGIPVTAAEALLEKVGAPVKPAPQRSPDENGAAPSERRRIEHTAARGGRLLSLAATHTEEELRSWWERNVTCKLPGEAGPIAVEPKVDGLTLRLSYEGGHLVEVRCRPRAQSPR